MIEVGLYHGNPEFHDATLLLGSNPLHLEQQCVETQAQLKRRFRGMFLGEQSSSADPGPNQPHPSVDIAVCSQPSTRTVYGTTSSMDLLTIASVSSSVSVDARADHGQVLKIPVHQIVLSAASFYFKTLISTSIGQDAADGTRPAYPLHPIIVVCEKDVEAAQGVLQCLYTGKVESTYQTASQLMQQLLIADRWAARDCVAAFCKALVALPAASLTFEELISIFAPQGGPVLPSLHAAPEFKLVKAAAVSNLLQRYGDVPTAIASCATTAQLVQLPHAAILALLSSDSLTSNCEDSVMMMASWWLGSNRGSCTGRQLDELVGQIRYSRISSVFLAEAPALIPLFRPDVETLMDLLLFRSLTPAQEQLYCRDVQTTCPAGWFKPRRPIATGTDSNTASLTLVISAEGLRLHLAAVRAMKDGGPDPAPYSTSVDFKGFVLTLSFVSSWGEGDADVEQFAVYLCVGTRLPLFSSMAMLKCGIPCSVKFSVHSNMPDQAIISTRVNDRFHSTQYGVHNFAQHASNLPGDPLLLSWWDPFMVDGALQFTAELTDQRTD